MRRLLVIGLLLSGSLVLAQGKKKPSLTPDVSLAGDLTRARTVAAPSLTYSPYQATLDEQIRVKRHKQIAILEALLAQK
jgi:hypothetical protein